MPYPHKKKLYIILIACILAVLAIYLGEQYVWQYFVYPIGYLLNMIWNTDFVFTWAWHVSETYNIIIDQSCAWIRFFSVLVLSLIAMFVRYFLINNISRDVSLSMIQTRAIMIFVVSYFVTIITNTSRILVSIVGLWYENQIIQSEMMHELIAMSFFVLMLIITSYIRYTLDPIFSSSWKH